MEKSQIAAEIKTCEEKLADLRKRMAAPALQTGWWIVSQKCFESGWPRAHVEPVEYLGETLNAQGAIVGQRHHSVTGTDHVIIYGTFPKEPTA